jgi:hypothetical protein
MKYLGISVYDKKFYTADLMEVGVKVKNRLHLSSEANREWFEFIA